MMSGENNNRTTTKTNVVPPSCNAKRWFFAKHCHTNSYAILFFSYFVSTVGIVIRNILQITTNCFC